MTQLRFGFPARWTTLVCGNCSDSFSRRSKYVKNPDGNHFCSISCSTSANNRARKGTGWTHKGAAGADNPNWKGGVSKDHMRYKRRFVAKSPEKVRAHKITQDAIRKGLLARQPCEVCGATERIHAHHDDHSKPLEIRWLCQPHHNQHHGLMRRGLAC
jgi:hypothetical protein